jgi:hypothetical protein
MELASRPAPIAWVTWTLEIWTLETFAKPGQKLRTRQSKSGRSDASIGALQALKQQAIFG